MTWDDVTHELYRWTGFAIALTIASCGLGFVYIHGKIHGQTGRFRLKAYRCVAQTVRFPNKWFTLSWFMMGMSAAWMAVCFAYDRDTEAEVSLVFMGGIEMALGSTVGRVMFGLLIRKPRQLTIAEPDRERPIPQSGIGPIVALDLPSEFVHAGHRTVFTGGHLATVEGTFARGDGS